MIDIYLTYLDHIFRDERYQILQLDNDVKKTGVAKRVGYEP